VVGRHGTETAVKGIACSMHVLQRLIQRKVPPDFHHTTSTVGLVPQRAILCNLTTQLSKSGQKKSLAP
jgi:hypothetical protein